MHRSALDQLMEEARNCALMMLDNSNYIRRELANVQMNDALRGQTEQLCTSLLGTAHDVMHELSELAELLESQASDAVISSYVDRIIRWLQQDIDSMHQLVTALESADARGEDCGLALVLVTESAANILHPFGRAKKAATPFQPKADGA